jgi:hypothetical protein
MKPLIAHPLCEVYRLPMDPEDEVTDAFVDWLHENPSDWAGDLEYIELSNPGRPTITVANGELIARRREAPDQPWFYYTMSEGDLIMLQRALAT